MKMKLLAAALVLLPPPAFAASPWGGAGGTNWSSARNGAYFSGAFRYCDSTEFGRGSPNVWYPCFD